MLHHENVTLLKSHWREIVFLGYTLCTMSLHFDSSLLPFVPSRGCFAEFGMLGLYLEGGWFWCIKADDEVQQAEFLDLKQGINKAQLVSYKHRTRVSTAL